MNASRWPPLPVFVVTSGGGAQGGARSPPGRPGRPQPAYTRGEDLLFFRRLDGVATST